MAIILDTIKVPLQKTDEFSKFSQAVKDLSGRRPNEIGMIVQQLTPEQKELLRKLLKTKRIVVGSGIQPQPAEAPRVFGDGEVYQVPREIVTIRRRKKN